MKEVLFKSSRDGGLPRCGETSEPDCEATLLAECVALAAGERRVPGDVAVVCEFMRLRGMAGYGGGAHVAIVMIC